MIQKLRILRAMLDLQEFTVAELSERANASESTVRTVLHRNPDLAEGGETDKRGRRGGAYIRHRLRPGAAERILAELGEVAGQSAPPPDILTAEAMLLDELPGEPDPAVRRYLRRRAEELLARVLDDLERAPRDRFHPDAAAHTVAVRLLLRLEDAEKIADIDRVEAVRAWRTVVKELRGARRQLNAVDDGSLYVELEDRIMACRLAAPSEAEASEARSFAGALAAIAGGKAQDTHQLTGRSSTSARAALVGMAGEQERAAFGLGVLAAEIGQDLVLVFSGRHQSAPEIHGGLASKVVDVDGYQVSIVAASGGPVRVSSQVPEPVKRHALGYSPPSSLMQHNRRNMRHYMPSGRAQPTPRHEKAVLTLVA